MKRAARSERSRRPAALWGSEFSGQSGDNNNWETDRNFGSYRPARQLEKLCTYNIVGDAANFGFVYIHVYQVILFLCSQCLQL